MRTIKANAVFIVAFVILGIATFIYFSKRNQQAAGEDRLPVVLHSLKFNDGWGYEVLVDGKVYIHQDCIPAIPSFKKFATEAEALKIGEKVVEKIKAGRKPSVTEQEIVESGIKY